MNKAQEDDSSSASEESEHESLTSEEEEESSEPNSDEDDNVDEADDSVDEEMKYGPEWIKQIIDNAWDKNEVTGKLVLWVKVWWKDPNGVISYKKKRRSVGKGVFIQAGSFRCVEKETIMENTSERNVTN